MGRFVKHNVLQLCVCGGLVALTCPIALKLIQGTAVEFSTETATNAKLLLCPVLFIEQFKNRNMTLNEWIVFGHVGMSSKTMWAVVTGTLNAENIKKFRVEIPYDKDDFSRCYTLWKECKLTDTDLRKIKETCPIWKPFIDNWYELVSRYENNEKMYEYMSELVEQGRLNAGWIKVNANTWKFPS